MTNCPNKDDFHIVTLPAKIMNIQIQIMMLIRVTSLQIMFKNKNEEEEEEEDPNASYNKKFYGDANKYDEDYYNNYIKQYQAQTMRYFKLFQNVNSSVV